MKTNEYKNRRKSGAKLKRDLKGLSILLLVFVVLVGGCSTSGQSDASSLQPELTIAKSTISVDDPVRFSLSGFTSEAEIRVSLDDSAGVFTRSDSLGSGVGSLITTLDIGEHQLTATDSEGVTATAIFQVIDQQASIDVLTPTIREGGELAYELAGFQANATVSVTVEGSAVGVAVRVGEDGSGSFAVPTGGDPGIYTLIAEDDFGNRASSEFTISGAPAVIALDQPAVSTGRLGFQATGFAPESNLWVFIRGGGGMVTQTDELGVADGVLVNALPAGAYLLVAVGPDGAVASTEISVVAAVPSLTITNSPIVSGEQLEFSFSGFRAFSEVFLSITGGDGRLTENADAQGSGVLTLPVSAGVGAQTLVVQDRFGNQATADLEIIAADSPRLFVEDSTIVAGQDVTFTIRGFVPGEQVVVSLPSGSQVVIVANATGGGQGVIVADEAIGTYTLQALGPSGSRATRTIRLTLPDSGIQVLNSPLAPGGAIAFSFVGMAPNSTVSVAIQDGATGTVQSDAIGAGQGVIAQSNNPGTWLLTASDTSGRVVSTEFIVQP